MSYNLILSDYTDLQKYLSSLSELLDSIIKNFDVIINQIKQNLTTFEELSKLSDEDLFKEILKRSDIMTKLNSVDRSVYTLSVPYASYFPYISSFANEYDPDFYKRIERLKGKISSFYTEFSEFRHTSSYYDSLKWGILNLQTKVLMTINSDELLVTYFLEHER